MFFQEGQVYTRAQISDVLAAQRSGYLPLANGKVAAGMFDLTSDAVMHFSGEFDVFPRRLSPGARLLESSDTVIPVFLKVRANQWQYAGKYRFIRLAKDKRTLDKAREQVGREDVAAVLTFQRAT